MTKNNTRRKFIKKGALASLAIPLFGSSIISCKSKKGNANSKEDVSTKKLSILILGGTSFLGPHQVAYALSRGHSVSTFTRGKTLPSVHAELFNDVEQLIGDREDNLSALENRKWDVVIDNSGRNVKWTKDTANLLKDNCGIYMYTSSTGVYYPYLGNDINEDTKIVIEMPEGLSENEKYIQEYGIMKANSEIETIKAFGEERSIIIRPTYMVGPADKTDRFMHWPVRLAKGGEILVPGKKEDLVQYIDVRDVAEWYIRLAENKQSGTYNAVGPEEAQTMQEFVLEAAKSFNVDSSFIMIEDYDFLEENNLFYAVPWIIADEKNYGSARINHQKAINAGLTYRPLKETVKDTYNWWTSDALTDERRGKFENNSRSLLAREKSIIENWKQSTM